MPGALARFLSRAIGPAPARGASGAPGVVLQRALRVSEALTPEEAGRFGGEELLVQGTIDCCFIEDGQWVLLDYKTDRTEDMDALRAHYAPQLRLYALALQRITGMPVKQRTLCLIAQGRLLEL